MATAAADKPRKSPAARRRERKRLTNRALHVAQKEGLIRLTGAEGRAKVDPVDALQLSLDRGVAMLGVLMEMVDDLTVEELFISTPFGPVTNAYVEAEAKLRKEVHHMAARMVDIGIADRAVRVREAQAMLIVRALTEAAREAGIPRDKVRALGPALRNHLLTMDVEAA